ncbi:MAG: methylated-DNA--[protein]-cysteine S-methyltransferase [Crocinitomicaceae bacterium]|nr:methylated-DNA--[protein]-cysteine S-methyltransferase [Crocinitomicaceae bacterium]
MIEAISIQYYKSPVGELILGSFQDQIVLADWRYRKKREEIDARIRNGLKVDFQKRKCQQIENCRNQLEEYFSSARKEFDLPLLFVGTDFQKRVWQELRNIPFGKTETYLSLSKKMGDVKAIRAVASANGANAISIIVPCHRIIGTDGKLIGYAGGLPAKKKLLELESEEYQLNLFES